MKNIRYLLKTKNYYVSCLVLIVLYLIIILSFSRFWSRTLDTYQTFNQFSSDSVAYDQFSEESDSFANFENSVFVSLTNKEGEGLNVIAYQFLENTNYTNNSIFNNSNIIKNEFQVLEKNEIAIPKSIANQYDLNVQDYIYVNGNKCEIKFIYRDVYQVFSVDYSVKQTIVLIGIDTLDLNKAINYCNFDPDQTMHSKIYTFNPIRKQLITHIFLYSIICVILTSLVTFVLTIFRRKDEVRTFRNLRYCGTKNIFFKLLAVELMYIIPSLLIVSIISILFNVSSLLILMIISGIIGWMINMIILTCRIMR